MILIFGSVITGVLASNDWTLNNFDEQNKAVDYLFLFLFYLVNYFIVVFFNIDLFIVRIYILKDKSQLLLTDYVLA